MPQRVANSYPLSVPSPDTLPEGKAHLRTLARTPPRDLTQRELLAGTKALVSRLYGGAVTRLTAADTTTVDVTFERESGLRVALLSDGTMLTREDVELFLELYSDSRVLLVFAGPVGDAARELCLDHPRIDYARLSVSCTRPDSQVVDWLDEQVSLDAEPKVTVQAEPGAN